MANIVTGLLLNGHRSIFALETMIEWYPRHWSTPEMRWAAHAMFLEVVEDLDLDPSEVEQFVVLGPRDRIGNPRTPQDFWEWALARGHQPVGA